MSLEILRGNSRAEQRPNFPFCSTGQTRCWQVVLAEAWPGEPGTHHHADAHGSQEEPALKGWNEGKHKGEGGSNGLSGTQKAALGCSCPALCTVCVPGRAFQRQVWVLRERCAGTDTQRDGWAASPLHRLWKLSSPVCRCTRVAAVGVQT